MPKPPRQSDLTVKQRRFVEEYLVDLNATQAAIRAGYNQKSASRIGPENLEKPVIKAEITKAMAERSKRTQIEADQVLQRLGAVAFADIGDVVEVRDGAVVIKDTANLSPEQRASIAAISQSDKGGIRVRLRDNVAALKLIGQHLGMFRQEQDAGQEIHVKRLILERPNRPSTP
jgi:phage terminase small subunit